MPLPTLRRHIHQHLSLTDDQFDRLAPHFRLVSFPRNHVLFRPGDRPGPVYFIVSGLMKLVYVDGEGREHVVSFAAEDWWEGDFAAFFGGTRAGLSLRTLEPTTALALAPAGYEEICVAVPALREFFFEKTKNGFLAAQRRIISLLTTNPRERYEAFCAQYPQLLGRLSKTQIAAYLGVSRETLSRLYSRGPGE